MEESKSFLMGIAGLGVSLFPILLGWMPVWVVFGAFIIAGLLYNSKFFATGIGGAFGAGTFTFLGWIPSVAYFTAIVLGTVFLAVRVASLYVNTGQNK